ncbi:MAG: hypothetical protein WC744_00080 [Patescibacteria group bacterium]|jgi:hypothetical protein
MSARTVCIERAIGRVEHCFELEGGGFNRAFNQIANYRKHLNNLVKEPGFKLRAATSLGFLTVVVLYEAFSHKIFELPNLVAGLGMLPVACSCSSNSVSDQPVQEQQPDPLSAERWSPQSYVETLNEKGETVFR